MKNQNLDIIYFDNHLVVMNKPAGLATQPSKDHLTSLEGLAKAWVKEQLNKPGEVYLHAVHRIDLPVSGIVVFAKTSKALTRLTTSIRDHKCEKTYLAIVEGRIGRSKDIFEDYLVHDEFRARVASEQEEGAKLARLNYELISQNIERSLIKIHLETGRYHQIRIQLAHRGHPILGDVKYGSKESFFQETIALHHTRLLIPHPTTGESLDLKAAPSALWRRFFDF